MANAYHILDIASAHAEMIPSGLLHGIKTKRLMARFKILALSEAGTVINLQRRISGRQGLGEQAGRVTWGAQCGIIYATKTT